MRIIADDKIPFLKGVLEPFAEVTYLPGNQINRTNIMGSDALLVRTRTRCNSELLAGTPVKYIGTATIGFDHIDTAFCEENSIKWISAPGCNSSSVQQYIAAALLRISAESGLSLKGRTIGIVGVGNVGSKVQNLANVLGMNVLLNDPPRERKEGKNNFVGLDQLLIESDIITLHVPLNMDGEDRTFHMFNNEVFSKVKRRCWLINSSRGEVVETEALKNALSGERIGGAVIDVWEREPEIDIPLMHMAFLATPHIAGYSADGKANGTAMIVKNLCESFNIPLTSWYPSEVPGTHDPVLEIDCAGKTSEEIVRKAVNHTYNIVEDDVRLRFDPSRFEKERENYPVRREFSYYSINLNDGNEEAEKLLRDLGFKVIS
ncbi:MAG: erythronate-4-phosphate dehydrogenase [Bacteroidetes bacterium RBG_19FT_COMBO_42_7]|nr:MAG: erythronate-4-phosphate dehydrogenase [Bacteroidetes bacterium RBG_19FT_COMBO_42_7]